MITQDLYKCPICKDTGWIQKEVEGTQPIVTMCKCQEIILAKQQWSKCGINPEQSKLTFSTFKIWNKSSQKAKDLAVAYYTAYKTIKNSKKNSIMFCGQVGSGKTHLSIALALNLMKKNIKVVYLPYRDVITKLKQNMIGSDYYSRTLSKYKTAEILLIDDLYKGKINETDINIMFEIINHRILNQMPVIISTEFKVDRMLNFDAGVGSRIYEMCKDYIIEIEGQENNYRLKE